MGDQPLSKWEQKQAEAKAAEAKFAENQARAAKGKNKQTKGSKNELDDLGSALGDVDVTKGAGLLGWVIGHKWILGVFAALVAGGVIFGMCKCVQWRLKHIPGWPKSELWIASSPPTLILIDHVEVGGTDSKGRQQSASGKGERLTAVDPETGSQLAVNVSDYKECWSGGARVICADKYDQIDILDPRTLDVAASAVDLIAAAKLAKSARRYERDGDGVIVVLDDGRGAQIDASSLKVTVLETVSSSSSFGLMESSGCATTHYVKTGASTLSFETGGTRAKLSSDPPPPAESPTPSGPALSFLEGRFLVLDGSLPIVVHKESMEAKNQLVSRVDGIAKERWTVPLGGECRRAWLLGNRIVVATGNAGKRAIAIDGETGAVAWQFGR